MSSKISRKDLDKDINELLNQIEQYNTIINTLKEEINLLKGNIPSKLSELENDTQYITAEDKSITSKAPLKDPFFSGMVRVNYEPVVTERQVPTKVSQLENDSRYVKVNDEAITSKAPLKDPKFTGEMYINNALVARNKDIPVKISQLENDSKYITADDSSIKDKANRAESGMISSIGSSGSYRFKVYGKDNKAAGITFDRGKYRVNFGLDVDNKLKYGGGHLEEVYEIIDSNNLMDTLYDKGLYLLSLDKRGNVIINNKNNRFKLVYNEITKTFSLKKV